MNTWICIQHEKQHEEQALQASARNPREDLQYMHTVTEKISIQIND